VHGVPQLQVVPQLQTGPQLQTAPHVSEFLVWSFMAISSRRLRFPGRRRGGVGSALPTVQTDGGAGSYTTVAASLLISLEVEPRRGCL